jgi:RHS repeat-associated protein
LYRYDAAGNLNYRTNNGLTQTFTVNSLNQLTGGARDGTWTVAGGTMGSVTNVTVNTSISFLYADGTFASTNHGSSMTFKAFTAIAKDDKGRSATNSSTMFSPPNPVFAYDLNGNLLFERSAGGTTNRLFEYDDENQLIRVMVTNAWKSEFVYDGKMRRRIRKEYTWNGSWVLTNEVRYVYDGNLVIQERDANNLPQVTYTRGKDMSGNLEGAGGIGGLLARTENPSSILNPPSSSAHAYYHADGNGNVTCLINSNQLVVARYNYDPFGSLSGMSGSMAEANLYRFSSKEFHPKSGLVYYLYRYYDPSLQRWLNRDPIGEHGFSILRYRSDKSLWVIRLLTQMGGNNLYGFVRNQPTGIYDPFGLKPGTPTGPDTLACIAAQEQAIAAMELLESEPGPINAAKLAVAIKVAVDACTPPPPPPPPPPFWKRAWKCIRVGAGAVGVFCSSVAGSALGGCYVMPNQIPGDGGA